MQYINEGILNFMCCIILLNENIIKNAERSNDVSFNSYIFILLHAIYFSYLMNYIQFRKVDKRAWKTHDFALKSQ